MYYVGHQNCTSIVTSDGVLPSNNPAAALTRPYIIRHYASVRLPMHLCIQSRLPKPKSQVLTSNLNPHSFLTPYPNSPSPYSVPSSPVPIQPTSHLSPPTSTPHFISLFSPFLPPYFPPSLSSFLPKQCPPNAPRPPRPPRPPSYKPS